MTKALRALCMQALWVAAAGQAVAAQLVPVAVQPSGPEVAANLLRISLVFAQPVGEPVLPRLELRQANGYVIDKPFLEQELWSPSGKILTVLLHPGRVKNGLIAHDTVGPVLHAGESVVLTLDGQEIKRWKVGSIDRDGPRPSGWSVGSVLAGTREPLVVELDAPIDGRDVDYLAVANSSNRRIQGRAQLEVGEKKWTFTPDAPWNELRYTLAVFRNLEDASGNQLNGHFESPGTAREPAAADIYIPLAIDRALERRQGHARYWRASSLPMSSASHWRAPSPEPNTSLMEERFPPCSMAPRPTEPERGSLLSNEVLKNGPLFVRRANAGGQTAAATRLRCRNTHPIA